MSRIYSLLLCFSLIATQLCFGGSRKITERTLFNGDKLFEYRLDNGLRILCVPRHQAKVLTYQTWIQAGSVEEKLDPKIKKTGLAHLFEHMMFRGTQKFKDGEFDSITKRMGAVGQNATTYYYRTNYYSSIPSSQLESLMVLESDRMAHLNLTLDLFEKEKGAVVGELARLLDSPSFAGNKVLYENLFKGTPYASTVIGSLDEIKTFTLGEAEYFYRTYYAPNNTTLIVVGDVKPQDLIQLAETYYGSFSAQQVPEFKFKADSTLKTSVTQSIRHPQARSELLMVGYPGPSIHERDYAVLDLLSTHLATGMESVLRKELIDRNIAVSANASVQNTPNSFEFFILLNDKSTSDRAMKVLDRILANLKKSPLSDEDLQRALSQEKLAMYAGIESNSVLANFLGESLMSAGNYMRGFEIMDYYQHITTAELQKVAQKYFKPNQRVVVTVKAAKK